MRHWLARTLLLFLTGGLVACANLPPFGPQPVVSHTNTTRQVLGYTYGPGPTRSVVDADSPPACPANAVAQANALGATLMRLHLGMEKLQVGGLLGSPAHAETFALMNGRAVEVFFYHTPDTICRKSNLDTGLLPMVFQDDKLLGYGQGYYHNFIVPMLRTALSNMPENSQFDTDAVPSAKAYVPLTPTSALAPSQKPFPRMVEEDLPARAAPASRANTGATPQIRYTDTQTNQIGAGDPLR